MNLNEEIFELLSKLKIRNQNIILASFIILKTNTKNAIC